MRSCSTCSGASRTRHKLVLSAMQPLATHNQLPPATHLIIRVNSLLAFGPVLAGAALAMAESGPLGVLLRSVVHGFCSS